MKKKVVISAVAVTVAIVLIVSLLLVLTNMFTRGSITGEFYRVDNVYEEIWNMVNSEKNGKATILTTSIKGSEIDYDFGLFENIYIPVNDDYYVVLSFYHGRTDELCIGLYENNEKIDGNTACFVYNHQSNTLYGNRDESVLNDKFTSLYYSWIGNDSKFSPENQGTYTYVFEEYPLSHDE